MDVISKLFEITEETLRDKIGISNPQHVELVMEYIEKFIIREYEDFMNWMSGILKDRSLTKKLMHLLLTQAYVYSHDSMARNIKSPYKLTSLLGVQEGNGIKPLWRAFVHRNERQQSHDLHQKLPALWSMDNQSATTPQKYNF